VESLGWVTVPMGLGLIGLAMLDVFLTVLHVQIESPISNRVNRRLWRVLLAISRRCQSRLQDEVLGWGAPLMIGGIVVFWSMLYIVGFALVYLPFLHSATAFIYSGVVPGSSFGDAIYFSATSFFTTGFGDILPVHPLARLLALMEGGFGLTTLSLSVTYLLSVYPLIARKMSLAQSLNQETGGRADAVILAQRYVCTGRYEALAQRLSGINDELLKLGQSHGLYPVLYFVHPRAAHLSFVRVLAVMQGIVATLRYGLDANAYEDVVSDPRLMVLEEGLLSTLHMLADSSHLAPAAATQTDSVVALRDYVALLAALREHGVVAASPDDERAREGHTRFRIATDQYLRAYAENAGYDISVARTLFTRRDRDSALVGQSERENGGSDRRDDPPLATYGADRRRA
jgi:ion channel